MSTENAALVRKAARRLRAGTSCSRWPFKVPVRKAPAVDLAALLEDLAEVLGSYGDEDNEVVTREAARRFRAGRVDP